MRLFEQIVVVDWSASSTPKLGADSIWIARCVVGSGVVTTQNVATRRDASECLDALVDGSQRTLVGVDFSLGYPAGTAGALGLAGVAWQAMWDLLADQIVDGDDNLNNRFDVASRLNRRISPAAGPFWGCPPAFRTETLTSTKVTPAPLREWRATESTLRSRGHRPFSSWHLFGAGTVGSQSLLGIAMLSRLADRWSRTGLGVDVWPFTTGLAGPAGEIVIAEVWPSLVDLPTVGARVRDDIQVETLSTHLACLDHGGELARWFTPEVDASDRHSIEREEGWILGA